MRLKLNNCTYIVLSNQQLMKIPNELILNLKGCATSTLNKKHRAESAKLACWQAGLNNITFNKRLNSLISKRI